MSGAVHLEKFIPRSRRAFGLGMAIALSVLAATILSGLFFVRDMVRDQISRRDAEALYATTLMEQLDVQERGAAELLSDEQIGFDASVRASRLRGVLGIRFFTADGRFHDTFPGTVLPQPLERDALDAIRVLAPHSRFRSDVPLDEIFIYLPQFATGQVARVPVLQVTIPLHQRGTRKLAGAAQFIIEGQSISDEFVRLDSRLVQIGTATFAVSGTLLVIMLWPAFRRLQKLNRNLALHGERLQRANDELALAARVSAVGAVSAHLMHGLKNPLASLSQYVSNRDRAEIGRDEDWQDALTASHRMQALVEHTVEVLNDAQGQPTYELTVMELGNDVQRRVAPAAERRRVEVGFESQGNCTLSSRTANLAGLVLVNLLDNAIEVTPQGGKVLLSVSREGDHLFFRVSDRGPGFPDAQRDRLFLPGKSSHEGGSGIGLAISKQIADYLDARLELESSSHEGCVFLLDLPMRVCEETNP